MKRWRLVFLFLLVLIIIFALFLVFGRKKPPPVVKQEGISYASWWSGELSRPESDVSLENLSHTGAEWLSLIVTGYTESITSTHIFNTPASPSDADVVHVIKKAHDLGLKVMLKPHLDLEESDTYWRGQIGQEFVDESEWAAWFEEYTRFLLHYADLAEANGVEQFCIGTELMATDAQEDAWRRVAAEVRNHFSGPITYAANHGGEFSITWWDAVDYIGIDAYFELTNNPDPDLEELKAAWEPYVAALDSLASRWQRQILFTEIGFSSFEGFIYAPREWNGEIAVDLELQANAYQATFESVFEQPWFAGLFWWVWNPDPFEGGPCDAGYNPFAKPAEDVLREWYGGPTRSSSNSVTDAKNASPISVYEQGLSPGWEDWSWDTWVNLAEPKSAEDGTAVISATIQSWGAVSVHYPDGLDVGRYQWLEFLMQGQSYADYHLAVSADGAQARQLDQPIVDSCQYVVDTQVIPGQWQVVRIPLDNLDLASDVLHTIIWQNREEGSWATIRLDEIRLR